MKLTPICLCLLLTIGCTTQQVPIGITELDPAHTVVTSPDKPVRVSSGIVAGSLLTKVIPIIPKEARCKHIGGSVVTHIVIGKDGKVISADAISSPDILRKPYADAITQWMFRPFTLQGQPVEVETVATINIAMNGDGCHTDTPQP